MQGAGVVGAGVQGAAGGGRPRAADGDAAGSRHAHATHALEHGHAPVDLVQATPGHASVATTSKYLHARPTGSSACSLGA